MCQDLDSKAKFAKRFTKQWVQFWPPTPPTLSLEGDFEAKLPLIMWVPLVWDMEDMFGTSKEPHRILKVVGTIKLDDFIREFDTCTIVVGVDLGAHDTMNIQHWPIE
jgi:hypothetical protein